MVASLLLNQRPCRSLTGAWIETARIPLVVYSAARRSLTGAWIETRNG